MECKFSNCLQHQGVPVYLIVIESFHRSIEICYFNLYSSIEKLKIKLCLKGLREQAFTVAKLTFTEVIYIPSVDFDSGFGSDAIVMASFRAMGSCKSCSQKRWEGFLFLKITIASSFFPD